MFNTKKDRQIVELCIEFNLTAIDAWLEAGSIIEDIEKIPKDWNSNDIKLSYYIDVLPNGQNSDMYFHRKKGVMSGNVGGIDYLENVDEDLKYYFKKSKIKVLSWLPWRQFIGLDVNQNAILLAPVEEIVELQTNRVLKNGGSIRDEDKKIRVPILYDDQNNPKEFTEIWRGSASDRSIGFSNALGSISASTLNFEVEY